MVVTANTEQAETLALRALNYLAEDEERLGRFMVATGLAPEDLRARIADPAFLSGVLDYMLSDDSLVVAFAEHCTLDPAAVMTARRRFPGAPEV
jgi:hypothetical protein